MIRQIIAVAMMAMAMTVQASKTLPVEGTIVGAQDQHISYVGRVSFSRAGVARFNFPGTQISARFTGTSLKVMARPETGFFMVSIDDSEPFKVDFTSKTDSVVTVATALQRGEHRVKMMYIIEGLFREPEFRGFVLDKGCTLLDSDPLPERKIEFIGNSITCGYGIESVSQNDPFEDATENHYLTYAAQTARNLGACHTAIARSGIGVYRNYNGKKQGDSWNMRTEYAYTLYNRHDERWDFAKYQPQVVCINLGTNDLSTNNYDISLYYNAYRDFIGTVRACYPQAKIVMLCGSMLGGKDLERAKEALNRLCKEMNDKGDSEIYRFDFTPQNGDLGYGASWHPSYWQHQKMAGELTAYLRALMKWF